MFSTRMDDLSTEINCNVVCFKCKISQILHRYTKVLHGLNLVASGNHGNK